MRRPLRVVGGEQAGLADPLAGGRPRTFVHWNIDNDDGSDNSVPSAKHPGGDYHQDTVQVTGENDLLPVALSLAPSADALASGTLTLRRSGPGVRVWRNALKGDQTQWFLVDVDEQSWDLSDAGDRAAFEAIRSALYVEGYQGGDADLILEYRPKNGYATVQDQVAYHFIAADCGKQPKTERPPDYSIPGKGLFSQRGGFEETFPALARCEWSSLSGDKDLAYNCIAWSIGVTGRWVWDEVDDLGDNDGDVEVPDFDAFYAHYGYVLTQDIEQAEILLYVKNGVPTHAARVATCGCGGGQWVMFSSKCGGWDLVEHRRDQLNGGDYGDYARYYRHQ